MTRAGPERRAQALTKEFETLFSGGETSGFENG